MLHVFHPGLTQLREIFPCIAELEGGEPAYHTLSDDFPLGHGPRGGELHHETPGCDDNQAPDGGFGGPQHAQHGGLFVGAEVRVVGTFGDPLVTGPDGILEARLRPGETELTVTADGWTPVTRTVSLSTDAIHDVSMVLAPSEVRIDRDANQIFLVDKVFFEVNRTELLVESLEALDGGRA